MKPNKLYKASALANLLGYGYTRSVKSGVPERAQKFISMLNGWIDWVFGDGCAADVLQVEGLRWYSIPRHQKYFIESQGYNRNYAIRLSDNAVCIDDGLVSFDTIQQAKQACQDHYEAQVLAIIQPLCRQPNSLDNV